MCRDSRSEFSLSLSRDLDNISDVSDIPSSTSNILLAALTPKSSKIGGGSDETSSAWIRYSLMSLSSRLGSYVPLCDGSQILYAENHLIGHFYLQPHPSNQLGVLQTMQDAGDDVKHVP